MQVQHVMEPVSIISPLSFSSPVPGAQRSGLISLSRLWVSGEAPGCMKAQQES